MRIQHLAIGICAAALAGCSSQQASQQAPAWLETDSAQAVHARLLYDFPLTYAQAVDQLIEAYPGINADSVRSYARRHYIETMVIDGEERMHRKAKRNLGLLNPAMNGGWKHRGWDASPQRLAYADSIMQYTAGKLPDGGAHRVRVRFQIDVPASEWISGDTLSIWMPYPIKTARQGDIRLIATSLPDYVISSPDRSHHGTICFRTPASASDTTSVWYEAEFTTRGQYFSPEYITKHMLPYDTESEEYKTYTRFDGPHYARLDSLAHAIVGDETNPYRQSELVFDYIIGHYPWAGAREYSTIPCLPQYVVDEGHGDCGQVALLYISLMRSLGVPARWESGWMLHPGEKNYHDWAEVYYNGIGWVPVDVSFGRYATADNDALRNFYSTGIDSYRFAANTGVSDNFYPPKRYLRSETVDNQAGEVETTRGNLFYPAWDSTLSIISIEPIAE